MPAPRPSKNGHRIKALAVPALLAVGLLLLVPGVWGVLVLAGVQVPNAQREGARTMAVAMLTAWPIALLLMALAAYLWWSAQRGAR